jgi:uncharacterized protein (TIGR04255 family)
MSSSNRVDKENMTSLAKLPDPDRSRLARSPLELVVCQVRHERRLLIGEGQVAMAMYEALGGSDGQYPALDEVTGSEMNVVIGQGTQPSVSETKTSGWRFAAVDGTWVVTVMADHFSLETTAYTTWDEDFAPRLEALVEVVTEHLKPAVEHRIGLRYIDRITELALPDLASWRPYLRAEVLGLVAHPELGDLVRAGQQHLVLELGEGVRAGLQHGPVPNPSGAVDYQLDYDLFRQGGRPFATDQIKTTVANLNTFALQLFQASVTDELLEKLK